MEQGRALGFARMGVARVEPLEPEAEQLRRWLDAGMHGQMDYMSRTYEVRADPSHPGMLPGARSVVVFVMPYARASDAEEPVGPEPGRIARYARGRDYHNVLHKRLRKLAGTVRARGARVRAAVDSMPVFERAWAERAGVGFVGKNCCLIIPGLGSHVFLGALVTSAELPPDPPQRRRCGDCTRCLDACPTGAFRGPRRLDARRCISYLTIEHRGPIEEDLRSRLGDWLFGCDVCQDVCPFNATGAVDPSLTEAFASRRWDVPVEALLRLDTDRFAALAAGSPVKRSGRAGLARNAALVLANTGARRALPVLREAAKAHDSEDVREAAGWAVRRLDEGR
ncbi:MAG: tRNA epoxyqueuosine(34) reductase QueG [Myxococcales bacterium]|nr:tRNA epoxyqueuosine(34) reductase QueG [Myxococcales bacterium]